MVETTAGKTVDPAIEGDWEGVLHHILLPCYLHQHSRNACFPFQISCKSVLSHAHSMPPSIKTMVETTAGKTVDPAIEGDWEGDWETVGCTERRPSS
jgi:hypothetical protein